MKSFRTIMAEVAQPRSPEEKKFKDMHSYETKSHPVAPDAVFTGAIGADDLPREKAKRKADQDGDANYDKQFKEGKAYGPTGVSYYVPDGHEDEVDPATGKKKNSKKEGLDYNPAKGEYNQKPGKEVGKRVGTREAAVNELSKKTLGNYIKTASADAADHAQDVGKHYANNASTKGANSYGNREKRRKGVNMAVNKLAGTKDEQAVNELSKATLGSYAKKAVSDIDQQKKKADGYDKAANRSNNFKTITKNINKASSADHRADNRKKGIVKAVDKLTREGLDEISKTKMGQYINRAHSDKDTQTKRASIFDKKGMDADKDKDMYKQFGNADKARKKAANRTAGIGKAVDKLTREELELEISEDLKMVSRQEHPKGGHIVTLQDKNGKKIVRHLNKGKVTDMKSEEAVDEGILDNIKKKVNDVRRKVVGPNQAEKDAARKKMMARQHDSTMKNIGSAMGAVAKKDKAAEVARLKQGLKNVENQRKESVDLDETTNSALMKPVTTTTPDGKKRTVMKTIKNNRTDDNGQDIITTESGVNALVKAATGGKMKMKESLKASILESLAQADVKETE